MASNKIYNLYFIAGNPEMFSNVRKDDRNPMTKRNAEDALNVFNRNGWRAWVEHANTGGRVMESDREKQWSLR